MAAVVEDLERLRGAKAEAQRPPMDKRQALAAAAALLAPARPAGPAYPVEALGPLADACKAIAEHGQLRPAMAGQSLLGAASLLTQGLYNVDSLGGAKPLSLFLLTLGDSGDGKSTAEGPALAPVWAWQREANEAYRAELQELRSTPRKKGDPPPPEPTPPHRICMDATVEGLRRDLDGGASSQGVFTSEAGALLAGYGMSAENRLKTAAVFSGLWDRGLLSVSRVTGGRTERHGCRIAMHWLVQPMAASEALADPILSSQGFWPRFLLAWPEPSAPRKAQRVDFASLPAVGAYWRRCYALLAEVLAPDADKAPVIAPDAAGLRVIGGAFERFEREAKTAGGTLRAVKPFALRATEQLCRVAGVLAAFGARSTIGEQEARNALALVLHSLETWRAVLERGAASPVNGNALALYAWLWEQPGCCATTTDILKRATPHALRSKDTRDGALDTLQAHGLIEREGSTVYALEPSASNEEGAGDGNA